MATGPYVRRIVSVYDGGKISRAIEFNVDIVEWKHRKYFDCLGKNAEGAEEGVRHYQKIDRYQRNDFGQTDNFTKSIYLMQCMRDGKEYGECLSSFTKSQNVQEDSWDSDFFCRWYISDIEDNGALNPWIYYGNVQDETPWASVDANPPNSVWYDNDGTFGLSSGDTIKIDGREYSFCDFPNGKELSSNCLLYDPLVKEVAVEAEKLYRSYADWKRCVENSTTPATIYSGCHFGSLFGLMRFSYDKDRMPMPLLYDETSGFFYHHECAGQGGAMVMLKGGRMYSASYIPHASPDTYFLSAYQKLFGCYAFNIMKIEDVVYSVKIEGSAHPDLAMFEPYAEEIGKKNDEGCSQCTLPNSTP